MFNKLENFFFCIIWKKLNGFKVCIYQTNNSRQIQTKFITSFLQFTDIVKKGDSD